jgi:hypothetical protein
MRPLFVSNNRRIMGLITILGITRLVFSLLEREARRALAPAAKVPHLLAGHVAADPMGEDLLRYRSWPARSERAATTAAGRMHRLPARP